MRLRILRRLRNTGHQCPDCRQLRKVIVLERTDSDASTLKNALPKCGGLVLSVVFSRAKTSTRKATTAKARPLLRPEQIQSQAFNASRFRLIGG